MTADLLDQQDVRAAMGGDGEAYGRLVARHQPALAAYLWRFTRDRREREELVQETFVEAYLSLRSYRGRSPLGHWLRKIATRAGYRLWKVRARQPALLGMSAEAWQRVAQAAPRELQAAEAAEAVHVMLAHLAPRDRLVLTLLYIEQCSVAEAAGLCGWTKTMVKVQAHRAKQRLRKLLEAEDIQQ
jgi:RNA polymerase sigma-70 factor (ECF subfamily)